MLETLDEKIFEAYGWITRKSMKTIGWGKYNLARLSTNTVTTGAVGVSTYSLIDFLQNNSPLGLLISGAYSYLAIRDRKIQTKALEAIKKIDEEHQREGTTFAPPANPFRPAYFLFGSFFTLQGIVSLNSPETSQAGALITTMVGVYAVGTASFEYFILQPPPPADKEPSWLDQVKEGVANLGKKKAMVKQRTYEVGNQLARYVG